MSGTAGGKGPDSNPKIILAGGFDVSGAKITLYSSAGQLDTMVVPKKAGRYWATWTLHGNGAYTKVNAVLSQKPTPAARPSPLVPLGKNGPH